MRFCCVPFGWGRRWCPDTVIFGGVRASGLENLAPVLGFALATPCHVSVRQRVPTLLALGNTLFHAQEYLAGDWRRSVVQRPRGLHDWSTAWLRSAPRSGRLEPTSWQRRGRTCGDRTRTAGPTCCWHLRCLVVRKARQVEHARQTARMRVWSGGISCQRLASREPGAGTWQVPSVVRSTPHHCGLRTSPNPARVRQVRFVCSLLSMGTTGKRRKHDLLGRKHGLSEAPSSREVA